MSFWTSLWKFIIELIKHKPEPDPEPQPSDEDLDITKIKWLGDNYSGAQMVKLINSASMDNDSIDTNYDPYDWPSKVVKVRVDAIVCIFYEKGSDIVGGKFDWWREGGQGNKTLENLHKGYNGHIFPSDGANVWECIVSIDGAKRSNIKKVDRR